MGCTEPGQHAQRVLDVAVLCGLGAWDGLLAVAVPDRVFARQPMVRGRWMAGGVHRRAQPTRTTLTFGRGPRGDGRARPGRDSTLTWAGVQALNAQGKLLPTSTISFQAATLASYACVPCRSPPHPPFSTPESDTTVLRDWAGMPGMPGMPGMQDPTHGSGQVHRQPPPEQRPGTPTLFIPRAGAESCAHGHCASWCDQWAHSSRSSSSAGATRRRSASRSAASTTTPTPAATLGALAVTAQGARSRVGLVGS